MIKFIAERSPGRNLIHSETPLIGDPHGPCPTFISSETPRFLLETPRAFIIQDSKLLRNTKLIIRDPRISLKNRIFFSFEPTAFDWRLQAVHLRPQIFVDEPLKGLLGGLLPLHPHVN